MSDTETGDTLESWITKSKKLRPTSKRTYLENWRAFVDYVGSAPRALEGPAAIKWCQRAREALEEWRDELASTKLKPQTINAKMDAARFIATRWSARNGNDANYNFGTFAERLRGAPRKEQRALTLEEAGRIIDRCSGDDPAALRDTAIFKVALRTGLRLFSIAGITFEDYRNGVIEVTLKGGSRYKLPPLDKPTEHAMGYWLGWLSNAGIRKGPVFRRLPKPGADDRVHPGTGLSPSGLYYLMKRRAEEAKIEGFHPHLTRHTFITWMRAAGATDAQIAAWTGHTMRLERGSAVVAPQLGTYTDWDKVVPPGPTLPEF